MRHRNVSWPRFGNHHVLRKGLAVRGGSLVSVLAMCGAVVAVLSPDSLRVFGACAGGLLLVAIPVICIRTVGRARRAEVRSSFAKLTILHQGFAIQLDAMPIAGIYKTRRAAVRACLAIGAWGAIVPAYGRYWALTGSRRQGIESPLSFRTAAVADIVPSVSVGDEAISA